MLLSENCEPALALKSYRRVFADLPHAIADLRYNFSTLREVQSEEKSRCGCRQVVRHELPKLTFAGSSPVTRSIEFRSVFLKKEGAHTIYIPFVPSVPQVSVVKFFGNSRTSSRTRLVSGILKIERPDEWHSYWRSGAMLVQASQACIRGFESRHPLHEPTIQASAWIFHIAR